MLSPRRSRRRTQRPNGPSSGPTPKMVSPQVRAPNPKRRFGDPRELVSELEASPRLPSGTNERFAGYGVMGSPFRSGHLLALRRFPASSA
jgi:hypothetical protein